MEEATQVIHDEGPRDKAMQLHTQGVKKKWSKTLLTQLHGLLAMLEK
jgi:hypothetical protein